MAIAGRVAMIPKGDYDSATTYQILDVVRYNDAAYVAKKASTGIPPTDTDYWMLMTQDGLPVDDELDEESENPVQNKVVSKAISDFTNGTTPAGDSNKLGDKDAGEYALHDDLPNIAYPYYYPATMDELESVLQSIHDNAEPNSIYHATIFISPDADKYGLGAGLRWLVGGRYANVSYGFQEMRSYSTSHNKVFRTLRNGTWTNWEDLATTADLANYLPKTGGTVEASSAHLDFKDSSYPITGRVGVVGTGVRLQKINDDGSNGTAIILNEVNGINKVLQVMYNGTLYDVLNSGNVGSYALPIGGGTVRTANRIQLILENTAEAVSYLQFKGASAFLGAIGLHGANNPVFYPTDGSGVKTLHHDGNSAKVVQATSAPSDTTAVWVDTANKAIKIYKDGAWTALA